MSFVDCVCQRPLESGYIFFENHPSYTKDEIKRYSETLENLNKNGIDSATCRPVEVNGKIYEGVEDQLLCDYLSRMQLLLLTYKYLLEYNLIFSIIRSKYDTLREAYSNISMWYLYRWYKPSFGTKSFSTYLNPARMKYLRERQENQNENRLLWDYDRNVHRFLIETIDGKRFQDTRRKYSLFINEIQEIVLPFVREQKERYKVR